MGLVSGLLVVEESAIRRLDRGEELTETWWALEEKERRRRVV